MWTKLLKPHPDLAALVLRLALALIFLLHGAVKLEMQMSWTNLLDERTQVAVAWGEFLCGVLLLLGLFSRVAALGISVIMVGAIILVRKTDFLIDIQVGKHGMNLQATGTVVNFCILTMCFALLLLGSGAASLDHLLWRRFVAGKIAPAPAPASAPAVAEKTAAPS